MPYIKQNDRDELDQKRMPQTAGELNYTITLILLDYIDEKGLNYQTINDILGALSGAGQEFYRRIAIPYEDGKIISNGDVY